MNYLSFDFLIKNEVVVPTVVALLFFIYSSYKQTRAENEENFILLKQQFREVWGQIAVDKKLKEKSYEDCTDEEKYKVFCVIDLLCEIHFLHGESRSRFAKQWRENINHIFSHKLMITGFEHLSNQENHPFSPAWMNYIEGIISRYEEEDEFTEIGEA